MNEANIDHGVIWIAFDDQYFAISEDLMAQLIPWPITHGRLVVRVSLGNVSPLCQFERQGYIQGIEIPLNQCRLFDPLCFLSPFMNRSGNTIAILPGALGKKAAGTVLATIMQHQQALPGPRDGNIEESALLLQTLFV